MPDARLPTWLDPVAPHAGAALLAAATVALAFLVGGYHPRHWAFVGIVLVAIACWCAASGRLSAWRSPAGLALGAGIALTAWTALSITWADYSRHLAWDEANRTLMYVAAFAVGAAICSSIVAYVRTVAWLAGASALVGVVILAQLALADEPTTLFVSGRLDWPIRYSNGLAAFCLVPVWLLLGLSSRADQRLLAWQRIAYDARIDPGPGNLRSWHDPAISAATLGGATLLAGLSVLAQSRGAVLAAAGAVVVALALSPNRASLALRLAALAAALALVMSRLGAPFVDLLAAKRAAADGIAAGEVTRLTTQAGDAVRDTVPALLLATAIAAVVGLALPFLYSFVRRHVKMTSTGTYAVWAATAVVVGVLFAIATVKVGSPATWIADNYKACREPASVSAAQQATGGSHFRDVGSNRCDFWRVAYGNFRAQPLTGVGANNFQGPYVQQRSSTEEPRQAHSLPLQFLGELGIVGALLFSIAGGVVAWAAWRYVTSGAARDPAFAGAITAMVYWFAHASLDWLWNLPAVTLPVVVLAGGLVACVSRSQRQIERGAGIPIAIGLALIALASFLPQGLADRAQRHARIAAINGERQSAADQAADASRWDPTWAAPVVLIANQLADPKASEPVRRQAVEEARKAVKLEPENWSVRRQASQVLARMAQVSTGAEKQQLAAEAIEQACAARRLNPQLQSPKRCPA